MGIFKNRWSFYICRGKEKEKCERLFASNFITRPSKTLLSLTDQSNPWTRKLHRKSHKALPPSVGLPRPSCPSWTRLGLSSVLSLAPLLDHPKKSRKPPGLNVRLPMKMLRPSRNPTPWEFRRRPTSRLLRTPSGHPSPDGFGLQPDFDLGSRAGQQLDSDPWVCDSRPLHGLPDHPFRERPLPMAHHHDCLHRDYRKHRYLRERSPVHQEDPRFSHASQRTLNQGEGYEARPDERGLIRTSNQANFCCY